MGEPPNLTNVFPDLFNDDSSDGVLRTGGDERREDNDATSQKMIVGVIPTGDEPDGRDENEPDGRDEDTSNAEQDHTQGEQQEYQTKRSRWPQNLKVYTRRQRAENDQVQREEEITLSQNPEAQVQPDLHDSSSSPSASDGIISPPHDDLDLPIALR